MAKKILIIDDDPVILRYLETLFQDNGYETVVATSSMEGLELVSKGWRERFRIDQSTRRARAVAQ